jgi:methylenetetrahydrofolate reductase (NADPH)
MRHSDGDHCVTPTTASATATNSLAQIPALDTEAGRGEPNNAASWDDFPNGRFGDFKSPAFGNQGPWGGWNVLVGSLLLVRLP